MAALPMFAATPAVLIEDRVVIAPDGRKVTLRIAQPHKVQRHRAALLLSHGANGTFEGLADIVAALAAERLVIAPLHVDSEAHPLHGTLPQAEAWRTRVEDMALAAAEAQRLAPAAPLVAVGHSYGALVAQALGGTTVFGKSVRDPRIVAVVAFSPPGAIPGFVTAADWAHLAVPMLLTTGTADVLPMIAPEWTAHLGAWDASAVAGSALWVGRGVDHYFGNKIQRLTREAPDQSAAFASAMMLANHWIAAIAERNRTSARWLRNTMPTDHALTTERLEFR